MEGLTKTAEVEGSTKTAKVEGSVKTTKLGITTDTRTNPTKGN